ncbi:MAG: ligand-binding sensor domain-containing protein, partial [Ardenticatenaceae bacterium]
DHVWALANANYGVGEWDGTQWHGHLPDGYLEVIIADPSGNVWAAPWQGGLAKWDGAQWTVITRPTGGGVRSLAASPDGRIWLGTLTGLYIYDGVGWTSYTEANSDLPNDQVRAIAIHPDGSGWIGTDEGLARFDGTTWMVYTTANSGLPADVISSVAISAEGTVWAGAFDGTNYPYQGGVAGFDGATWTTYTTENSSLQHEQVEALAIDPRGNLWIGTASDGIAVVSPDAGSLPEISVRRLILRVHSIPNGYEAVGIVRVRDESGLPVSEALVRVEHYDPVGNYGVEYLTTNARGTAIFRWTNDFHGTWSICVLNVSHPDYRYDPSSNNATCREVDPFQP